MSTTLIGSVGEERAGKIVLTRFEYKAVVAFPPWTGWNGRCVASSEGERRVNESGDVARIVADDGTWCKDLALCDS